MINYTKWYNFVSANGADMSKAEKTRAFIIEQTAPIFNRKGYAGTSLNDITQATGLTKGSIYGNFANKDEVALAVFDYNLQRVNAVIRAEMEQQETAEGKLMVYVKVYSDFTKYPFLDSGCPILNTATEADDTHAGLSKKAGAAINSWKNYIVKLIEGGIKTGEFRPADHVEQIALTMIALIEGAIMIGKTTGKLNYRKAIMRSVEKIIMDLK
jgi:TetR/AcrR family transcriptional repressor of nem operon